MSLAWLNLTVLLAASVLMPATYIVSLLPMRFASAYGSRAWVVCAVMRTLSNVCEAVMVACLVLWIWHPVPMLDAPLFANGSLALGIAFAIGVPFLLLDLWAVWSLGMETHIPSRDTPFMNAGIYRYIRHPQVIFEISLFPLAALGLNSLPLFVAFLLYLFVYMVVVLPFEEADLLRKYGEAYRAYQKNTGAVFPRLWPRQ